jgi:hypothetical protein
MIDSYDMYEESSQCYIRVTFFQLILQMKKYIVDELKQFFLKINYLPIALSFESIGTQISTL